MSNLKNMKAYDDWKTTQPPTVPISVASKEGVGWKATVLLLSMVCLLTVIFVAM